MAQDMTMTPGRQPASTDGTEAMRAAVVYRPNTDILETEDHVVVVADMPGVTSETLDITLERRVLTIRGRVAPTAPEGYRRIHAEYGQGDFERVFTVSDEVDRDRIEASLKNGVLTLKMPKAPETKPRRIEVRAS